MNQILLDRAQFIILSGKRSNYCPLKVSVKSFAADWVRAVMDENNFILDNT
ncbi:MAG: hypothetical protein OEY34_01470 [Cyclobacteriaceae bacterium]|nr:hypothetical protein [Cyclobacteriaceae bacterium]